MRTSTIVRRTAILAAVASVLGGAAQAQAAPVERLTGMYSVSYEVGRDGWVDGFLASTGGGCHESVWVRLFARRSGRDRFVGKDVTESGSADGYFSIEAAIARGVYYVKVRRQVGEGEATVCRSFRSRAMRLRHREGDLGEVGPAGR